MQSTKASERKGNGPRAERLSVSGEGNDRGEEGEGMSLRSLVDAVGPKVLPVVVTYTRFTSCRSFVHSQRFRGCIPSCRSLVFSLRPVVPPSFLSSFPCRSYGNILPHGGVGGMSIK